MTLPALIRPRQRALDYHDVAERKAEFAILAGRILGYMREAYDRLPVLNAPPEWAHSGHGESVFHVALPLSAMRVPSHASHALNSLMNHMFDRGLAINRMARVERNGMWQVWVRTD